MASPDTVDFVSGTTRMFGIIGHPIAQVRSPEMFTAEFHRRGQNALMVPVHVLPEDFDAVVPDLMKIQNVDGLIFTIPFKSRACPLADEKGRNATITGAVNALARNADGRWHGEVFDGLGCVEAFRRRDIGFSGKHVMLIAAGGAGSAIGVAIAFEHPASMQLYDIVPSRSSDLAERIRKIDPAIEVTVAEPTVEGKDILLNASPVGMLDDPNLPIQVETLLPRLVVFDAIVKPERTPLLTLAERCGCQIIFGTEMMAGQISKMVDHFGVLEAKASAAGTKAVNS